MNSLSPVAIRSIGAVVLALLLAPVAVIWTQLREQQWRSIHILLSDAEGGGLVLQGTPVCYCGIAVGVVRRVDLVDQLDAAARAQLSSFLQSLHPGLGSSAILEGEVVALADVGIQFPLGTSTSAQVHVNPVTRRVIVDLLTLNPTESAGATREIVPVTAKSGPLYKIVRAADTLARGGLPSVRQEGVARAPSARLTPERLDSLARDLSDHDRAVRELCDRLNAMAKAGGGNPVPDSPIRKWVEKLHHIRSQIAGGREEVGSVRWLRDRQGELRAVERRAASGAKLTSKSVQDIVALLASVQAQLTTVVQRMQTLCEKGVIRQLNAGGGRESVPSFKHADGSGR